ncbi:MAG: prephenate dehydratase domain-containing protein, partial [candidate division WOR-3 bacterium]
KFSRHATFEPAESISDIFSLVEKGAADYGMVPVENSTEGVVRPTLDRFMDTSLSICAESYFPVRHCLLSNEKTLDDIKTVYSMKFLGKFTPIREIAPGVPEELAKITEKAMATDPKQRYGSADEFLSEFEESGEEVFYLSKPLTCDMDLPLVRRARMTLCLEIRDDAILEMKGMRYPLVVSPGAVFPVEITLSGHGEFQCVLRARSKDFTIIDGPFRDISLGREETQKALWQVRAPDENAVGEFELQIYRSGQSVLREPLRFRAMAAVYARVEEKKK